MKDERISKYRIYAICGICISSILASGILCIINKLEIDQILCIIFILLGILPVIIFQLMFERNRNQLGNNPQNSYNQVLNGFLICTILMVCISFLPEFYRPVLLFPIILSAYSNERLSITSSIFFNMILALTAGGSFHELLAYSILTVIGIVFSHALSEKNYRIYSCFIFLFTNILFSNLFYYLSCEEITTSNFILSMISGICIAILVYFFYPKIKEVTEEDIVFSYKSILEENYVQVQEVRSYSFSEYMHAKKVSSIACKYATALGLDANLCEAAGFYYRLGKWEGEPFIENAIKKAYELCFPEPLIQILREYNGEEELPSTPESALIHIIDALLIKLELLEKEVGTSQWNREVLIYQTLNEFSSAGLYDKSGLSINTFIKIRIWLAKEELLA